MSQRVIVIIYNPNPNPNPDLYYFLREQSLLESNERQQMTTTMIAHSSSLVKALQ